MERLISLIQRLFRKLKGIEKRKTGRGRRSSILDLPVELMRLVLGHLSVVSRACLVLSCKRFYYQFEYVLKLPDFRYPYSDGLDSYTDYPTRKRLLMKLESKGGHEFFSQTPSWKYCIACIKLHPRSEFDLRERKEYCKWPGLIILCPCIKFTPKKIPQLFHELRTSKDSNAISVDITKHIPDWHQCTYSSPIDGLAYSLAISISLDETERLLFYLNYSISIDRPYQGKARIMLCPHTDALKIICESHRLELPDLSCSQCHTKPSICVLENPRRYLIQYKRGYDALPKKYDFRYYDKLRRSVTDYNWKRYRSHRLLISKRADSE